MRNVYGIGVLLFLSCVLSAGSSEGLTRIIDVKVTGPVQGADISSDDALMAISTSEVHTRQTLNENIALFKLGETAPIAQTALSPPPPRSGTPFLGQHKMFPVFTADAKHLLVLDAFARIHVLDVPSLSTSRVIQLSTPKAADAMVTSIQLSPNNEHIGVLISQAPSGGELDVYDLQTGEQTSTWRFEHFYVNSFRWFPDSGKLVVSTTTTSESATSQSTGKVAPDLQICDLQQKVPTLLHLGYPVGDIAFAGPEWVFTVGAYPNEKIPLRIVDLKTGNMVQEVPHSESGVRYHVSTSIRSDRVLAYIGREKMKFSWLGMESTPEVIDQRFQVWDWKTGKVIATSPALKPLRPLALTFKLSASGRYVLVVWHGLKKSPTVFQLSK